VINLEKLDEAIAYIEANPAEHRQQYWFTKRADCGTAFCLAGAIVFLAGWQPAWGKHPADRPNEASIVSRDGQHRDVQELAVEILAPDTRRERVLVDEMFSALNTFDHIKELRAELAGER
jgi:hypothetical protein